MTTFRPCILKCPDCKNMMYTYELTSYYVHSSVVYSDGKIDCNPPRSWDKSILICSECNKPMWRDDVLLEAENLNISYDELPEAKDVHDLLFTFNDDFSTKVAEYYADLLENGFANTVKREVYLRVELWRLLNNKERYKPTSILNDLLKGNIKEVLNRRKSKKESVTENNSSGNIYRDNLKKMISIFKPVNEEQQMLLAEMHRELGNFSKALNLLNEIEDVENKFAFKRILSAIKRKQSKVIKIN